MFIGTCNARKAVLGKMGEARHLKREVYVRPMCLKSSALVLTIMGIIYSGANMVFHSFKSISLQE